MEIINEQNLITNIFLQSKSVEKDVIYQTSSDYVSSDEEIKFNEKKILSINCVNKIEINDIHNEYYEKTIKKRIIINRQNIILIKEKK